MGGEKLKAERQRTAGAARAGGSTSAVPSSPPCPGSDLEEFPTPVRAHHKGLDVVARLLFLAHTRCACLRILRNPTPPRAGPAEAPGRDF
jgi:hypothetical protein